MGISGITLLLFMVVAPVVLYLIVKTPKNSLYLLVATFPMFNVETINLGGGFLVLSPNKVFGFLVIVLMVVDVISKGKEFRFVSPHMVLSLLLLAMLLLSFMVNGSRSLNWAQRYLSNLAFLLAMVTWVETREEADRVWQVFIYSLGIFTLLALLGLVGDTESAGRGGPDRFEATMLNANRAARTYLIGLGLAIGWLMRIADVPWRRWMGFGMVAFFAWSLLLTGSRSGLIALVITSAGLPFLFWFRSQTRALVIPMVLAVGLFVAFAPDALTQRVGQIPNMEQGLEQEEARRTRYHQYRLAAELIDAYPFLGIGPSEFKNVYSQRIEGDMYRPLHSWYLKLAVDAGIPALVLYVSLLLLSLGVFIRGGLRGPSPGHRGQCWGVAMMIVGLMAFGVVSSVPYSKLMWLVFSLAAVELRMQQLERDTESAEEIVAFHERSEGLAASAGTVVVIKKD